MPFQLSRANAVDEALAAARAGARYIAGGTTLVDLMRDEVERPTHLVDINRLPLRGIRVEDGTLVIGALARMADVAAHPDTRRLQPLIAEALVEGASPQLRNMASIGGNLLQRVRCPYFRAPSGACNKREPGSGCAALAGVNDGHAILGTSEHCIAVHPSDLAVSLVALDATVQVRGADGERSLPVERLYRLPQHTPHLEHELLPGELLTEIRVPAAAHALRARYLKVRDRASYEFALVSVAAAIEVAHGKVRSVRLAAGGVGTRPWRLRACEEALVGQPASRASFERAARLSVVGVRRSASTAFKATLLPRTLVRALELARDTAPAGDRP